MPLTKNGTAPSYRHHGLCLLVFGKHVIFRVGEQTVETAQNG